MELKLTVTDWTHGTLQELPPHHMAPCTLIPNLLEEGVALDDVTVLQTLPEAGLEPGVPADLVVYVVGDAEGDGGVPLDDRGEEVQANLIAHTVL